MAIERDGSSVLNVSCSADHQLDPTVSAHKEALGLCQAPSGLAGTAVGFLRMGTRNDNNNNNNNKQSVFGHNNVYKRTAK